MGKLFNLKEWLTVADTAKHLETLVGGNVTEADVLRLGLDGRLRLSVYFVNRVEAYRGVFISYDESSCLIWPDDPCPQKLKALIEALPESERTDPVRCGSITHNELFVTASKNVTHLGEVWDLPMIGAERVDIESKYQSLTGGPAVERSETDEAYVQGLDGNLYQLQAADRIEGYFPATRLPDDAVIVVRTEALREFEEAEKLGEQSTSKVDKPISPTERNTLLTIIAALCEHSGIEIGDRGVPKRIANMTEVIGAPVDDETVRRWLKLVPDAVETRTK